MAAERRFIGALAVCCAIAPAQWHSPPAGIRSARTGKAVSILPGGRVVAPLGEQYPAGVQPLALAVSASGKTLVAVDGGAGRASVTVLERDKNWTVRQLPAAYSNNSNLEPDLAETPGDGWRASAAGLALSGERSAFVSEGTTGRVAWIYLEFGEKRRTLDLNQAGNSGSFSGDLAFDAARNILYVADLAHSRVAVLDTRSRRLVASIQIEAVPLVLALGPDRRRLYVATARNLARGGGPSGSSVCVVDVAQPRQPRVAAVIRAEGWAASSLAGLAVTTRNVFISDAEADSVTVVDAETDRVERQIPIRIPGFESLRGVQPTGMAYDPRSGWLLVAEAGINAIAVIDPRAGKVLGHLPAGWRPTQIVVDRGTVYVLNRKGQGGAPRVRRSPPPQGSVSIFAIPQPAALPAGTKFVMAAAGFEARPGVPPPLPDAIRHVVVILKQSRSFDEILGDLTRAGNGPVMTAPRLARFGHDGYVDGGKRLLSLHHIDVTPNHHAIARQWAFSDNFYADAETNQEGVHWLSVWTHLLRHGISFSQFSHPFDANIPDTGRAQRLIADLNAKFGRAGADLPQFLMIQLPNDRMAAPHPESGYPYEESYLADNDVALGRILEYLSGTKWWPRMAVFVTEASAEGGFDHVDAQRTLLLCAGPWARRNWVAHTNSSFPGLLKTIFRLLGVPPLDLFDASAADLSDCFATHPDPAPYHAVAVDPRIYRPR